MKRGLLLNIISNIVFFVSGYVMHYFLGNTMPPASYGVVGTIITVLDFEYMFVNNGARQSVAKEISQKNYDFWDIVYKTSIFQLGVIVLFFCVNYFGSSLFGIIFNDDSMGVYFKIAAFLVVVVGVQSVLLGINDGLQHFGTSALLNTFYPIAKLGVIPLIIFFFRDNPVIGVEIGFILAVFITIMLGCVILFHRRSTLPRSNGEKISLIYVAHHVLSFSFFFIVVSLVLSMDTLIVKAVVTPASMAGYYTGAMNFGKISYYLLQAFSAVILPVVAKQIGQNRIDKAIGSTSELLLIAFSFILPISVIISASSSTLLSVFYGQSFAVASPALSCLSFSSFFVGITVILNMVINSSESTKFSDILSIISLIVTIPLFIISAMRYGITGIAVASVSCTGFTMLASFVYVIHRIGNIISVRICIVFSVNIGLWLVVHCCFGHIDYINLLTIVVIYVFIYIIYILLLFVLNIFSIEQLKNIFRSADAKTVA
ncbi:oligosaccharide flippase family protein [Bifidobacterium sp. SO4]|uniref:lipopolysaccharide biosynthesis protein n=1 Tax=Bifidobacterium sp. SO4 TaxID=2809030 RepID=UPI001BDC5456|nr:oligosaccharide flippase family protein [Bifidobacterium sp. SO4]MBT1170584.1 oligosaccharide flippase family protein [Bifidobacterium sp. SO4]